MPVTESDRRIITLVAQGLRNQDIAAVLGITEQGVKNRLRKIYDKLGVWNRVEVALWHERQGEKQ
jgi:two-component system, NarL family, nitrate/nitrite response regulator NarL